MKMSLSMTDFQYQEIKSHLIQNDELERVVWALCGVAESQGVIRYSVHKIFALPENAYLENEKYRVKWKTQAILPLVDEAETSGMALLKVHNHPEGAEYFSEIDDMSDDEMAVLISDWSDSRIYFISCVMTSSGRCIGRTLNDSGKKCSLSHIMVIGAGITLFESWSDEVPQYAIRNAQAFGEKTFRILRNLTVGVVGCSGTGSQLIEQLVRLGVGKIVLVDFDVVEEKNLNRITNVTMEDALAAKLKADALLERINAIGLDVDIVAVPYRIQTEEAVRELSVCDVVFGCLDTKGGRHTLNRLSSYYSQPYFDVGVRLDADGKGGVEGIYSTIHYVTPGIKSLLHRGIFSIEDLRAENKYLEDPEGFSEEYDLGYVKGVNVDRPAVIPVNAVAAGICVLDFLSRLHNFRAVPNEDIDKILISISGEILSYESVEAADCDIFSKLVGRGNCEPLLGMPSIEKVSKYEIC